MFSDAWKSARPTMRCLLSGISTIAAGHCSSIQGQTLGRLRLKMHKERRTLQTRPRSTGSIHKQDSTSDTVFQVFQTAGQSVGVECVRLTDVDPPAVALHQQQHKHMQRNEVDDEDVSSPC